jgi:hypothetical protein
MLPVEAESLQTQLARGELQAEEKMVDMLTFLMRMLTSMKENADVIDSWGHWGRESSAPGWCCMRLLWARL